MAPGPRGFATWALLDIVVGYTSPTSIGPSGSPHPERARRSRAGRPGAHLAPSSRASQHASGICPRRSSRISGTAGNEREGQVRRPAPLFREDCLKGAISLRVAVQAVLPSGASVQVFDGDGQPRGSALTQADFKAIGNAAIRLPSNFRGERLRRRLPSGYSVYATVATYRHGTDQRLRGVQGNTARPSAAPHGRSQALLEPPESRARAGFARDRARPTLCFGA